MVFKAVMYGGVSGLLRDVTASIRVGWEEVIRGAAVDYVGAGDLAFVYARSLVEAPGTTTFDFPATEPGARGAYQGLALFGLLLARRFRDDDAAAWND